MDAAVVDPTSGKPKQSLSSMAATDAPQLGNLSDALEKYSLWRSENITPPSSPTLPASSPVTIIALPARDGDGAVEAASPASLTSESDGSPSHQSKSTYAPKSSTTFSSPPWSDTKVDSPFIKLLSPLDRPSRLKPSARMLAAAQLTPASIAYTQPTYISSQLLEPVYPQGSSSPHTPALVQGPSAHSILPLYWVSKQWKSAILQQKLGLLVHGDGVVAQLDPVTYNAGLHVFVDLSNITIGFYDLLKRNRGIPVAKRLPAPPFCFENFALVLERARPVFKRIVAGSLVSTLARRWPMYMQEAEDRGYEMNILQRVHKNTPPSHKKGGRRFNGSDQAWTTSGGDSSDEPSAGVLRRAEQGVDEILHLKIMQSLVDYDQTPGTIVLATGDAATAEFSDGFKSNVERALNRGWTVELYAWSSGTSASWKDSEFKLQWGDKFRIIELDAFVEELLGVWTG